MLHTDDFCEIKSFISYELPDGRTQYLLSIENLKMSDLTKRDKHKIKRVRKDLNTGTYK